MSPAKAWRSPAPTVRSSTSTVLPAKSSMVTLAFDFSKAKLPLVWTKPNRSISTAASTCRNSLARARSREVPGPVLTLIYPSGSPSPSASYWEKSTTVVLGSPASVPPPLFTATCMSSTERVTSSIPMNRAPATFASRDVQVRRSVWVAGSTGAFGFIRARANPASLSTRPMAPGLSAGPLTPVKACTRPAPAVSSSTATSESSLSTTVASVFSKAKSPEAWKNPNTPSSTLPSTRNSSF